MREKFILLISFMLLAFACTSYANAKIVYVDATDASDPNVAANTTLATGEVFTADDPGTAGSGADGLWRKRAFANEGTIFESGGSWEADLNTEDCPRLMTSVDVPEGAYDVYVYFWADGDPWRIAASLENSEDDLPLFIANDPNGGAAIAVAEDFEEPVPMLTEGNRTLWQAYLGTTEATTNIVAYIDDEAAHITGSARTWYDGIGYKAAPVPEPTVPFSVGAVEDITLDNGPRYGQDGSGNGSGLEARDVADRRHVFMLSYDISALKGRGPVSNVSLNNFSHDQHGEVNVYGIIEDLDLLEVESLTWNTAPGVKNDPAPELNTTVTTALDVNELTGVLVTFTGPGETGVRFSTDTSDALANFINSDTDGIITLLVVPSAEGNQLIVRSREHSAGGSLLEGEIAPIANIVFVTSVKDNDEDGIQDDVSWVDWLEAEGYAVDSRPGNWIDPMDPNKIAELEAADLIIASRGMATGQYDGDETTKWNSISTPIICINAWMIRSNRWVWMNSTSANKDAGAPLLMALDTEHPIFAGVLLDGDGLAEILDPTVGSGHTSFLTDILDVGNGTLIAQSLGVYNTTWIAEWEAGVEYYDGAGQFAGGPRMLFMAGTQDDPYTVPDSTLIMPVGLFNLNDAGQQMFRNAIEYLLPTEGPEGLVAYYALEGDATDSSGNGLDGTIMGDPAFAAGVAGMAMDFDGDGDYVDCGNPDGAFDITEQITVAAWVSIRSLPTTWCAVVVKGEHAWRLANNGSLTSFQFGINYWQTTGDYGVNGATQIPMDEWHHVCGTYDGATITLYMDGAVDGTTSNDLGIDVIDTTSMWIGANSEYQEQRYWDGLIDEVMIFERALAVDEVAALAGM